VFLLALLLLAQPADTTRLPERGQTAADSSRRDIIYYGGKRVIFFAKSEEVVLLDSAWVRYREMSVYSDSIHYDVKKHVLTAHRDVLFNAGSENITGALLEYDVDSRKGMMRTARTAVENGFFRADEVWLVRERVMDARRASYTTCDREHPHYVFYGPRVKLLMDDVAIAEPMVFKVGSVPLLAAPFWMVPVASKRRSGLLPFKVGNSSTEGLYSKNLAYYWVINDYSDMTFYGDVMTKMGLQGRVEGVCIVNPYADVRLNGSYIREWTTQRQRYSMVADASSQRFLFGSEFNGTADIMSDQSYVPDYSEEQIDWLKPDLFSYGQITRDLKRIGSVSVIAQQKTEFTRHQRWADLPSVRLSLTQRPLFAGWGLSPSASFLHHTQAWLDSANARNTAEQRDIEGRASLGLSGPAYTLGPLGVATLSEQMGLTEARSFYHDSLKDSLTRQRRVTNSAGANMDQRFLGTVSLTEGVSVAHSDNLRDTVPVAVSYAGNLNGRVTLFRVYSVEALGMHGLMHKVDPSAGLSYVPKVDSGPLFGRPHFLDPSDARVNLGLNNAFQAKVDTLRTKRDLGSVNFSSAYDLLTKRLSPLLGTASTQPLQSTNLSLTIDASAGLDLETLRLRKDWSVNTAFSWSRMGTDTLTKLERGFRLSLNHAFGADSLNMLKGTAAFALAGWKLDLTGFGYNFARNQLTDYGILVTRDLHCWEAVGKLQKLGKKWSYDFELRIKKLPDLKLGKSTFGSLLPKIGE